MNVKVSIIIPTYNRAELIEETLSSVMAQTLTEWECIVVDDGSSDGTKEIIKRYQEKDTRFKYIPRPSNRKKGGNTCRNIGIEQSKGEFIQFLDSDDLISANKLEEQLAALANSDIDAIATCKWGEFTTQNEKLCVVNNRPTYINAKSPLELLNVFGQYGTFLLPHVYLTRKTVIDRAGEWNEDLVINQDGEYFTRIILSCSEVVFAPAAEVYYRKSTGTNVSLISSEEKARGMITSWRLIDAAIEKKFGISNHEYVRQAKTGLFRKIKEKYPNVIADNDDFFKTRRSKLSHIYMKILIRLKMFFSPT